MKKSFLLLIALIACLGSYSQTCLQPESVKPIILEEDTIICLGDSIDLHGFYNQLRKTDTYTVSPLPFATYPTYTYAGTQISVNVDDIYSPVLSLPFSFCFFNIPYSSAVVGSNGLIAFNPSLANSYCQWNLTTVDSLPTTLLDRPAIFGPYQDIDPSVGGQVYWQLTGTAPFRRFVASFKDIPLFSTACRTSGFLPEKSQIILHENTNIIDVVIERKTACTDWNDGLAIEGIQNGAGNEAYTVPGRNRSVWSTTNDVWRFCPAGDTVPSTSQWFTSTGVVLGQNINSLTFKPSELPITVYYQVTYLNCGTNFVLMDSIKISGDSTYLNLAYDRAILDDPQPYFVEGCENINFSLEHTDCNMSDTVIVIPKVVGSITPGADILIPDTIFVLPYQTYNGVIQTIQDGIVEGFESATVYFEIHAANDSLSATMSFTLHDSIHVIQELYDPTKCPGDTETMTVTGDDTLTYSWQPTFNLSTTNEPTTTATLAYPITYRALIDWKNCPTVTRTFNFQVDTFSLMPTPMDTEVCYGIYHLLAANPTLRYPNMTWEWTPAAGLTDPTSETTLLYPTNDVTIVVTGRTTNDCVASGQVDIRVRDKDFLNFQDEELSGCPRDTFLLEASGAQEYLWVPGTYLDDSTSGTTVSRPITSITYELHATDDIGCKDTGMVHIELNPTAILELGEDVTLYPGEEIDLSAQGNCSFFEWNPANYLSDPSISNPTVSYSGQDILYVVRGNTPSGCEMLDSIMVLSEIGEIVTIPNAFNPTGNGQDISVLKIIKRGDVTLQYYRIFNRWGQKIFETEDIHEGWDGSYKGEPQPIGTYVYDISVLDSQGRIIRLNGTTTLIK